ncbi:MAG: hypothetical protein JW942_00795 [Opitutales bacterium]|nr:hypothetical protein [Opitutales bacterium]
MKNRILKSILALLALIPSVALADITMHIDALNDEFWFSGSATGTLTLEDTYSRVQWSSSSSAEFGDAFVVGLANAFTFETVDMEVDIDIFDSDDTIKVLLSYNNATTAGTLTANSYTVYTYDSAFGGLSTTQEAAFESLIGQTIPLGSYGSGFGGLQVVPEPSEVASALGLGALAAAMILRRRKTA